MNSYKSYILFLMLMWSMLTPGWVKQIYAQQTTTGPVPPPGIDQGMESQRPTHITIPGVPAYTWHHGCGPTAVGMVVGYWDGNGYPNLVLGDASIQNASVNAMIADDRGNANCAFPDGDHYQDYSCPIDGPSILPDKSETGGAHSSNCVADFFRTSWSLDNNAYGWSWYIHTPLSFTGYVNFIAPEYKVYARNISPTGLCWEGYKAEIDAGRPVVLFVDPDGNGEADHAVTGMGYDNTTMKYGTYNTWDKYIHWFAWREVAQGNTWGIYGITLFQIFDTVLDTAWIRRYDGPAGSEDFLSDMAVDSSGNVYVTGSSDGDETKLDYVTIKYYADGDTAWVRTYNGPENSSDSAVAIAVDTAGNVYVTGSSVTDETNSDYVTIKYNPDGDTAWIRTYSVEGKTGYNWDMAYDIAVDSSENVYVTGSNAAFENRSDYATIKYYPNGDTAWVRTYNGQGETDYRWHYAYDITVDASGNVYVTGSSANDDIRPDYATIKYYPDGDTAWVRTYNGLKEHSFDAAYAMAVDPSGNVYVTGSSGGDYLTIKYYHDGDTAWVRRYSGVEESSWDEPCAIAAEPTGDVYVTGSSGGNYTTIKYYSDGNTAWIKRFEWEPFAPSVASAIVVDASGNVYVTGYTFRQSEESDFGTIKYDSAGKELWVEQYNGIVDSADCACAIALDNAGNIYVSGHSVGAGTQQDLTTIKYFQTYSVSGKVKDLSGTPLKDSLVYLSGDRTSVDTTDSDGNYKFARLPAGYYNVFRNYQLSKYEIFLTSDTSGFDFRAYTDVNDFSKEEDNICTFNLLGNYPNPFNLTTIIEYSLSKEAQVQLTVYNILGQKVKSLINEYQREGLKRISWDGKDDQGNRVASSIYFYRLQTGSVSQTKKMLLIK